MVLEHLLDVLDQADDGLGRIGHPEVGPPGEVVVVDRAPRRVGLNIYIVSIELIETFYLHTMYVKFNN